MGEKPLSIDEAPGAGAQGSGGGAAPSGGSTVPQQGISGGVGEPIPGIDVKLGKNPGGA